ncbi:MAG TPA: hypothetical protein VGG72_27270 [Bryobacteraceae bacterium]
MKRIFEQTILLCVASGMVAAPAFAFDDRPCPDTPAWELFKYQIVFERAEQSGGNLRRLNLIHIDAWERGGTTGFYVREPLPEFSTDGRMVYLFDKEAMTGGGTCPAAWTWTACVEEQARIAGAAPTASAERTCTATLNIRGLPAWKPSPDSPQKRQVADELRRDIEAEWGRAQEIVVRDFDLRDPDITMYLRFPGEAPGGGEFKGCAFHSGRPTVCDGWHLFGQSPLSSLRKWVFAKPYRLK